MAGAVGAGGHEGDEVAGGERRQLAVERQIVAGLAHRPRRRPARSAPCSRCASPHRPDLVMRLVQRRPDQVVHGGIDDR